MNGNGCVSDIDVAWWLQTFRRQYDMTCWIPCSALTQQATRYLPIWLLSVEYSSHRIVLETDWNPRNHAHSQRTGIRWVDEDGFFRGQKKPSYLPFRQPKMYFFSVKTVLWEFHPKVCSLQKYGVLNSPSARGARSASFHSKELWTLITVMTKNALGRIWVSDL